MEQLEKTDLIKKLSALQEFIAEMKLDGMYLHSSHYRDDTVRTECALWYLREEFEATKGLILYHRRCEVFSP